MTVNLVELRHAIAVEKERMNKRPVPTEPWVMPLGLDDLLELVAGVERAKTLKEALTRCADWPLEQSRFELSKFARSVLCDGCSMGAPRVVTDGGALHDYGGTMVPCHA